MANKTKKQPTKTPPTPVEITKPVLDRTAKLRARLALSRIAADYSVVLEPKPKGLPGHNHFRLNETARTAHRLFLEEIYGEEVGIAKHLELLPDNGFLKLREDAAGVYLTLLNIANEHRIFDLGDPTKACQPEQHQSAR